MTALARYVVGDVFQTLATLPPSSVDLIATSPPFLALRSYLPADHVSKAKELGSETTPGAYLDMLLDVVEACARVLAPHGSLVFELGDTYSSSSERPLVAGGNAWGGHAVGGRSGEGWHVDGAESQRFNPGVTAPLNGGKGWPLDKSKCMIPQLFGIALAYGLNPLTGRTTEPWRVRNTVAWVRPNPPVGRDGDKFRPATSFLTVACKGRDRYWDGDAVRTEPQPQGDVWTNGPKSKEREALGIDGAGRYATRVNANPAGAPLLDWWQIPTEPYAGSHYATFPRALVVPIVKSMCPQRVCRVCGKPSTRITGEPEYVQTRSGGVPAVMDYREGREIGGGVRSPDARGMGDNGVTKVTETLGWSDCGHNNWRPGVLLDPFAGSGTTLAVATGHGLDAIGIDLDHRNADLAYERIGGLFLTIETR